MSTRSCDLKVTIGRYISKRQKEIGGHRKKRLKPPDCRSPFMSVLNVPPRAWELTALSKFARRFILARTILAGTMPPIKRQYMNELLAVLNED